MLVLVDVDGTVADLSKEWLRLYNEEWGDNLTSDKITDWDISKFVLPEVGKKIYNYLERNGLYENVEPIPGALEGVKAIRKLGHRVVFASAGVHQVAAKFAWLKDNGFDPGANSENFISIYDKTLLKGDLLIDDRYENVWNFGDLRSILIDAPHNRSKYWYRRARNWTDVVNFVQVAVEMKALV